jgi:hypothetical protein
MISRTVLGELYKRARAHTDSGIAECSLPTVFARYQSVGVCLASLCFYILGSNVSCFDTVVVVLICFSQCSLD